MIMSGILYGVGVGPGDPELMTLKAVRLIRENEVIALGYVESFTHLPSKLYLALRNLVEIEGICVCGDFFSSKMIGDFFYFNNRQTPIYRNKKFPLLYKR